MSNLKSVQLKLRVADLKELFQLIYSTLEPFSIGNMRSEQMVIYLQLVSVKDKISSKLVKHKDDPMNHKCSLSLSINECWALDNLFTDLNTYHQHENSYWLVLSREFYTTYRKQLEDLVLKDTIQSMRNI